MGSGGSKPAKSPYKVMQPTLNNPPTVAMDAVAARNAAKAGEADAVGDTSQAKTNIAAVRAAEDPSHSRYRQQSAAGAMQGLKSSSILTG